jgi:glycine cleavage system aminomethyltransferase T
MSSPLYSLYAERYTAVRNAVAAVDVETLREIELELPELPEEEALAARLAIHDVYRRCPMRAERHLRLEPLVLEEAAER